MKELLGYEFFTIENGVPLEFDPTYGQEYAQRFQKNIAKLPFRCLGKSCGIWPHHSECARGGPQGLRLPERRE